MSYRLIDSNELAEKYPEVNDMPCMYADLPNGLDGKHYDVRPVVRGKWIVEVWNNKEHHTCSSCQHIIDYEPCYHYCPMCGAEMESEE